MKNSIEQKLKGKIVKKDLIVFIEKNPSQFNYIVEFAQKNNNIIGWRAAWLLFHIIEENDKRIKPFLKKFVLALKNKADGHQRELLKIIEKMKINKDIEGYLFNQCIIIWEDTNKSPSVRIIAFRHICSIAKKYPELKNEILFFTQNHYSQTLSPGIKNIFFRLKNQLFN